MGMDSELHDLFKNYYENYPKWGKNLNGEVSNILYYDRMNSHGFTVNQLSKYVGHYKLPNDRSIEMFLEKGELFAKSKGMFYLRLLPTSKTHFLIRPNREERFFVFKLNSLGDVIGFSLKVKDGLKRFGQETFLKELLSLGLIEK